MTVVDGRPWYRLGYVSPHPVVDTLAFELYRMAPPGLMVVTTGLEIGDYTPDAIEAQIPNFRRAAALLAERRVDRIVLSGVPLAAGLGRSRMLGLLGEVAAATGVPVDTDLEAIVAGLRHLALSRVGLATRWHDDVNVAVTRYLADGGITVVNVVSDARSMRDNARLDDATGIRLAEDLGTRALSSGDEAQALVMPGGRWLVADALEPLEARFGKPVLVNFAAALWAALHARGYEQPITGWGRLLASLGG